MKKYRRQFLQALLSGISVGISPAWAHSHKASLPTAASQNTAPLTHLKPDLHLQLSIVADEISIRKGQKTRVWRYKGKLIRGPKNAFSYMPDSYLSVIRLRQGQHIRIDINNHLPEHTTVHWHGLHVPADMDGQPRIPIAANGGTFTAEFVVADLPGTYWFHPHTHERVGPQVYQGLAGMLIIDPAEPATHRPEQQLEELALVIQDRSFDANNQLVYIPHDFGGRMDHVNGFLGANILVNGRENLQLNVKRQHYRLRILNGSNARIYKLAWSDGSPVTVIGNGAGLLSAPVQRPYVNLAPAERREILVDFAQLQSGQNVKLISQPYIGGTVSTTMGSSKNALPIGAEFELVDFKAQGTAADTSFDLPALIEQTNAKAQQLDINQAHNSQNPRRFALEMSKTEFTINGKLMADEISQNEIVKLGQTEVWEFDNITMIPHPMHIHNLQFRVLERTYVSNSAGMHGLGWAGLDDGFVDAGWHDTVLVMPGQRVRILMQFTDYTGLYMYHCHNLEHEDGGMMRYYLVKV